MAGRQPVLRQPPNGCSPATSRPSPGIAATASYSGTVVNEVLDPNDGMPFGFGETLWYRAMGPALLQTAFQACDGGGPAGNRRFINDLWPSHTPGRGIQTKRQSTLALLARTKADNLPVQGLGFQAHLEAGVRELDQARLATFFADVAALGYKIVITELDVRDNRIEGDAASNDCRRRQPRPSSFLDDAFG